MHRTSIHHAASRKVNILLAALVIFVCSVPAHAGLITTVINEPNDCAGFFGDNFPECTIFGLSPVITKFSDAAIDAENGVSTEINSALFPSVTGLEWVFAGTSSSGTWTYTPGPGDPDIRFYTVKAANQFSLNYLVPDASQLACTADPLSLGCLGSALAFPTGVANPWETATGQDVSHITFYDSDGDTRLPEPGTALLLTLGGLGFAIRRRRAL